MLSIEYLFVIWANKLLITYSYHCQSQSGAPGALFEDKPQSANDAWRKLHSDPLLLIRQREQEAVARIKNNPIKMAMIKKSVSCPIYLSPLFYITMLCHCFR